MYDAPETFASFYEGYEAFKDAEVTNPYPPHSRNYGPWEDGWLQASDDGAVRA